MKYKKQKPYRGDDLRKTKARKKSTPNKIVKVTQRAAHIKVKPYSRTSKKKKKHNLRITSR